MCGWVVDGLAGDAARAFVLLFFLFSTSFCFSFKPRAMVLGWLGWLVGWLVGLGCMERRMTGEDGVGQDGEGGRERSRGGWWSHLWGYLEGRPFFDLLGSSLGLFLPSPSYLCSPPSLPSSLPGGGLTVPCIVASPAYPPGLLVGFGGQTEQQQQQQSKAKDTLSRLPMDDTLRY